MYPENCLLHFPKHREWPTCWSHWKKWGNRCICYFVAKQEHIRKLEVLLQPRVAASSSAFIIPTWDTSTGYLKAFTVYKRFHQFMRSFRNAPLISGSVSHDEMIAAMPTSFQVFHEVVCQVISSYFAPATDSKLCPGPHNVCCASFGVCILRAMLDNCRFRPVNSLYSLSAKLNECSKSWNIYGSSTWHKSIKAVLFTVNAFPISGSLAPFTCNIVCVWPLLIGKFHSVRT